jgi:hypothetical protein
MQTYQPVTNKSSRGNIKAIVIFAVLALLALGGGYYLVTNMKKSPFLSADPDSGDKNEKTMAVAPLTGVKFEPKEAEKFIKTRPLAVMVNNHTDARPQSGLIEADLVYEIVAEGGITRFLAFFNSSVPEKIGPVRSTREYYLVLVKELGDAMLMHIGYSPQALEAIESWPVRSLSRGGAQFWRDEDRLAAGIPTEHTAYVNGKEMLEKGVELGWEGTSEIFESYKFKEDSPVKTEDTTEKASELTIDFWNPGDYSAIWKYDSASNSYLRSMGYDANDQPLAHNDQENKKQISAKNVVVQFAKETSIVGDDKNRLDYELIGSGEGLVFIDGKVYKVTWSKSDRDARTKFYTLDGEEVAFNRGKFWIAIVPDRNIEQVQYK